MGALWVVVWRSGGWLQWMLGPVLMWTGMKYGILNIVFTLVPEQYGRLKLPCWYLQGALIGFWLEQIGAPWVSWVVLPIHVTVERGVWAVFFAPFVNFVADPLRVWLVRAVVGEGIGLAVGWVVRT